MKRFLALLLCAAMLLSVTACKKKNQTPPAGTPSGTTTTTTTTTEEEGGAAQHAIDPVVNRFLNDMVHAGAINSQSIHRTPGPTDTTAEELNKSYSASINGLPITMRNASYEVGEGDEAYTVYRLHVSIDGDSDQRSQEALMTAFSVVAAVLGCDRASIDSVTATLEETTENIYELPVSDDVKVMIYTPIISNSEMNVFVPCRIEIMAFDYEGIEV